MLSSSLSLSRAQKSLATRFGVVATGTAIAAATLLTSAPGTAHAAITSGATTQSATTTQSTTLTPRQRYAAKAERVLRVVSNQQGDPYQYGATGPNAFDCSGLMYFAFQRAFDRTIPRTANDQKRASKRIWHRKNLRPGDLVFEVSGGGYAYHVGIYAGHGYFWHAPHTGSHVKRQKMYPSHWRFGRLIRT
jgi:cell wall-associated NlpC family hydrolase